MQKLKHNSLYVLLLSETNSQKLIELKEMPAYHFATEYKKAAIISGLLHISLFFIKPTTHVLISQGIYSLWEVKMSFI